MKKLIYLGVMLIMALSFSSCAEINMPDEAKVAAAKQALTIAAETDCDLDLRAELMGAAVSWRSSDEAVISNNGVVARQTADTDVVLTATLTVGSASDTKEFTVTVTGLFRLTVTVDKTEVSVGDTVEVTATFYNLSGRDYDIEFPDWICIWLDYDNAQITD